MRTTRLRRSALGALAALVTLAPALDSREAQAQFQSTPTLFSGQATAVEGQVLGVPIVLVDTGTVAPEGGTLEAHLLCYPSGPNCALGLPDMTNGALSAEVLNATVIAQGHHSRARASVAELSLNVLGQSVSATLVEARASAECTDGQASIAAASELAHLTINGQAIAITGEVNQTVPLPLGAGVVVINEQVAAVNSGTGDDRPRVAHQDSRSDPGHGYRCRHRRGACRCSVRSAILPAGQGFRDRRWMVRAAPEEFCRRRRNQEWRLLGSPHVHRPRYAHQSEGHRCDGVSRAARHYGATDRRHVRHQRPAGREVPG